MRRGHPDGERVQEARGLDRVFSPRAVAVVGASTDPNAIGHQVLRNILEGGYRGAVHPVNLRGDAVLGKDAFRSVLDVPGPVDLAVIVVPSAAVLGVAEDCAKKGVKGLVVISAGFREAGPEGAERERRLEGILRRSGMRMVGPNCLGIINSNPYIRLNAIFGVATHRFGPLAIMSQSGALALALLAHSADIHLGVARFASMGNKADVSGNDLLLLWEHDPDVKVIAMYIESFGNPRNFVRIARRISRTKPILVVKSGRSTGGARAASSHTGAMAEADRYVDALLDQCGVLRAATVEELFDEALALSLQPLPRGPRVGIITNSGGPAIMAADALDAAGLRLADLSAGSLDALSAILPPEATPGNPIDLLAGGGAAGYARAVEVLAKDPGVDAIVVICTPIMADDTGIAEALVRASRTVGAKPVLCVFFGRAAGSPGSTRLVDGGVPSYAFPESAVRSLGAMWRLSQYRSRPEGKVPPLSVDADRAARFLAPGRERPDGWLRQDDALELLAAYGFRVARFKMARSADEAAAFAKDVTFPVVLKAEASTLVHKTDVGGVKLGLRSAIEVRDAFHAMQRSVRAAKHELEAVLVMHQEPAAREVLLGLTQDRRFGPLVAFGLGGIYTEVLRDVVFHLAPLTDEDAKRMVRSIRAFPLLEGTRGQPSADLEALEDALMRLSRLAVDHPEIAEMELNPFFVRDAGQGAVAIDARVRVQR